MGEAIPRCFLHSAHSNQITRIMVRDRIRRLARASPASEPSFPKEIDQKLRMMHDLEARADLGIVPPKGVPAMGTMGHDGAE